jgi:hypothetical protein
MSQEPKISVLMTVYNAGAYLRGAVESILGQTFADFEFLIVDDGSTDGSGDVIRKFAAGDSRIRAFFNEKNIGQTACLNKGLREARSVWVARQDADDLSLQRRFEHQWARIQREPELVILGVNGWIINEHDKVTGMIHVPAEDAEIRASLAFRNPFIHAGVMFRREAGAAEYDEAFRICQDWEMWARLLRVGRAANLGQRLVAYRHHESSLSHASVGRTREESEVVVERAWAEVGGGRGFEPRLLRSFREGLKSDDRAAFWRLSEAVVPAGARAVQHIQAAGALMATAPADGLAEVFGAFRCAPGWTLGVLMRSVAIRLGWVGPLRSESSGRGKAPTSV